MDGGDGGSGGGAGGAGSRKGVDGGEDGDGHHIPVSRGMAMAMLVLTALTVLFAAVGLWLALD